MVVKAWLLQVRSIVLKLALVGFAWAFFAALYMDAWLIEKLNAKKWTVPAVVYARPLELYAGLPMQPDEVLRELQATGYQNSASRKQGTYRVEGETLDIYLRPFRFWDGWRAAQSVHVVFGENGISSVRGSAAGASRIRLEPMEIGRIHTESQEDRALVRLQDVPQSLVDALIITEDRYFFKHHGVSWRGILRALFVNTREGKVVEGASTLTQQLIKNFFLEPSRSYSRKLLEASLAVLLELHVDKNTILEAYINEVFVAQNGAKAVHGFGMASQYLFGMPLSGLRVEQTALLVAMMKGPSYYNPVRYPERALERRNLVISLLAKEGKLDAQAAQLAMERPLGLLDREEMLASYPAYLDVVRRQLRRDFSHQALTLDGLRIFTYFNPQWQWRAQRELAAGIVELEEKYGPKAANMEGAVVITDNASMHLLAVVGSKQSRISGFNRALDAKRSIGSLVKPAIYLTAFQNGYGLHSQISDEPLSIKRAKGYWSPQNYDHKFHGEVPLYYALAKSYNAAAVRMGLAMGIPRVIKTLQLLGVEEPLPHLPALFLGAVELTPVQVAQVYSTMASQGVYRPLQAVRELNDSQGNRIKPYPSTLQRRFQPDVMHLLDAALRTVISEGTGSPVKDQFPAGGHVAGKTGTTNDQRDSWFAGYDQSTLVVVWLGHDDNAPLPVTGGSGALPIWANIIAPDVKGSTRVPENVQSLPIDNNTDSTTHKENNWFKKWFQ
jgi:penicillin-binding protein 1B